MVNELGKKKRSKHGASDGDDSGDEDYVEQSVKRRKNADTKQIGRNTNNSVGASLNFVELPLNHKTRGLSEVSDNYIEPVIPIVFPQTSAGSESDELGGQTPPSCDDDKDEDYREGGSRNKSKNARKRKTKTKTAAVKKTGRKRKQKTSEGTDHLEDPNNRLTDSSSNTTPNPCRLSVSYNDNGIRSGSFSDVSSYEDNVSPPGSTDNVYVTPGNASNISEPSCSTGTFNNAGPSQSSYYNFNTSGALAPIKYHSPESNQKPTLDGVMDIKKKESHGFACENLCRTTLKIVVGGPSNAESSAPSRPVVPIIETPEDRAETQKEWRKAKKSYRIIGMKTTTSTGEVQSTKFAAPRLVNNMPDGKAPHFPQQPVARQNDDGSLELECFVDAAPAPTIKWFYDNVEVKKDGRFSQNLNQKGGDSFSAILSIKDLADADAGAYRCCIVNPHGKGNANFNLKLTGFSSPTFVEKPQISSRDDGQVMVMEFRAKSILPTTFVWSKLVNGSDEIVADSDRVTQVKRAENDNVHYCALEIKEPTKEKDAGQFVCTAKNDSGKLTATFTVKFEVPEGAPSFTRKPQILQQTSQSGEPAICFDIGYTAKSSAFVTWINPKGKKMKESSRIKFTGSEEGNGNYNAKMELTNYKAKDSGTYTCNIKNESGEANVELTLNIEGLNMNGERTNKHEKEHYRDSEAFTIEKLQDKMLILRKAESRDEELMDKVSNALHIIDKEFETKEKPDYQEFYVNIFVDETWPGTETETDSDDDSNQRTTFTVPLMSYSHGSIKHQTACN